MPWRNGGGTTTEIAAGPPGADLDAFDWRISRATVAADGPFSLFPGVERTLVVCAGAGLRLQPCDALAFTVEAGGPPVRFAADVPHHAALIDGAITDLNVMTRRTHASHRVTLLTATELAGLQPRASLCFLVCLGGSIEAEAAGGAYRLEPGDALRIGNRADLPMTLLSSADARAAIIDIWMREP